MNLVIKVPDDLRERVASFPFLQTLIKELRKQIEKRNEELSEEEEEGLSAHIICLKEGLEVLNLLPFKAFYHEVEKEDLKTVFSAHRAVKNMKIEGPDVFISCTESFVDASLGKSLGAKERIGLNKGKNNLFFSQKVPLLKGRHLSERLHQVLGLLLDNGPAEPQKGYCRRLDPLWEDWIESPYNVINVPIFEQKIDEQYTDFFDLVEGEKFVFLTEGEEDFLVLNDWSKSLPKKNEYVIFDVADLIKFSKLIAHAQVFFSEDSPLVNIAAYCGSHVYYLRKKDPINASGPLYFLGDVRYFDLNEPRYKEAGRTAYSKIFDELLAFLAEKKGRRETDK